MTGETGTFGEKKSHKVCCIKRGKGEGRSILSSSVKLRLESSIIERERNRLTPCVLDSRSVNAWALKEKFKKKGGRSKAG